MSKRERAECTRFVHGTEHHLRIPFEEWPTTDLDIAITWSPPTPGPGQTAQFTIEVGNKGKRSIERAWVQILIAPCCPSVDVKRDWFPHIAAGQSVRLTTSLPLPDGLAIAYASVKPGPSLKVVRESNPDNNEVTALVGHPSRR